MFNRCRHEWEEVDRKAVKGAMETGLHFKFGGGLMGPETRDALYGYTLILYKCKLCGKQDTGHLQGAWEE